jgi:glycosyltransferase involved in cell wall biosynthesis
MISLDPLGWLLFSDRGTMIEQPYLLVLGIPCYIDAEGRRYLDELWHKDLIEHLTQIEDLTLASPLRKEIPAFKVIEIDHSTFEGTLRFVDLPPCVTTLGTLTSLPRIVSEIWKAVGKAKLVHAGPGGWPISLGWFAIPMAKLRGKFALTNVESAAWRLGFKRPWRPKPLIQAVVFETLCRVLVNISDLATFTQAGYRSELLIAPRQHRGHVICASWIDSEDILERAEAETIWDAKLEDFDRPLRAVVAATLNHNKGIPILLEALKELERRGVPLAIDIYGKGPLLDHCIQAASSLTGSVKLNLRGMIDYGQPFMQMLQTHDVILVPSISDEQPRIVFDSFAQALPVIASDTPGLIECVTDGFNGKIVPSGNIMALADAIEWATRNRQELRELGIRSLDTASSLTHDQMHSRRAEIIKSALGRLAVTKV